MQDKITIIDLFCGTGGFAQGFLKSDPLYEVIYSLDVDKDAANTAKLNHPNALIECGDIRKIDIELVKNRLGLDEASCVIGGPPCQGFSGIGIRRSYSVDKVQLPSNPNGPEHVFILLEGSLRKFGFYFDFHATVAYKLILRLEYQSFGVNSRVFKQEI